MRFIDYLFKVEKSKILDIVNLVELENKKIKIPNDFNKFLERTYNYLKLLARSTEPIETNKKIIVLLLDVAKVQDIFVFMSTDSIEKLIAKYVDEAANADTLKKCRELMGSTNLDEWLYCEVENATLSEFTDDPSNLTDECVLSLILLEAACNVRKK